MSKKFSEWNQKKIETENIRIIPQFKKREIWWVKIGENVGFEQSGRGENFLRPVLIFKKFNHSVFWGIPLTTQKKEGKFYFAFQFLKSVKSIAILSQLRLFDAKRLEEKMGTISCNSFKELEKAIQEIMNGF